MTPLPDAPTYWTVTLRVFAFDTKEQAEAYQAALIDAFSLMPESGDLASTSWVQEETA